MMSWLGRLGLGLAVGVMALPGPTLAAGSQVALVVGNGTYASLPVLAACPLSAHAVSAALRRLGFDVVEREDTSSGALDAAIGDFAGRLTPGGAALVYVCGYGTALNGRPFLLPVSASISRPTDVLTQGLLARTLLDALARANPAAAALALDVVPAPGAPQQLGLQTLTARTVPDGVGLIAAVETMPAASPTPLAAALVAGLAGPQVTADALLAGLQQQVETAKQGVSVAAMQPPSRPGYLAGAPAPPPPPRPSPPAVAAVPPAAIAPPAPSPSPQPPPPAAARVPLPAEAQMTDQQRRQVQIALAGLGYYDGRIDGVFGPDTRAAIRRYQHELHADMTGTLSADQATRLVSGAER